MILYTFTYKRPRGGRIKTHRVYAESEREAIRMAPIEIGGGWVLYGLSSAEPIATGGTR